MKTQNYEFTSRIVECSGPHNIHDAVRETSGRGDSETSVTLAIDGDDVVVTLVVDARKASDPWAGFYFSGSIDDLCRSCFRSEGKHRPTLSADATISLFERISTVYNEKDASINSVLMMTAGAKQAFLLCVPVGSTEASGFVPLKQAGSFHSVKSVPLWQWVESTKLVFATDVDRNKLIPDYPEVDVALTQAYLKLDQEIPRNQWERRVLDAGVSSGLSVETLSGMEKAMCLLVPDESSLPTRGVLASSVSCTGSSEGDAFVIDFLVIQNTRVEAVVDVAAYLCLIDAYMKTSMEDMTSRLEFTRRKQKMWLVANNMKKLHDLFARGPCIYNPFLDQHTSCFFDYPGAFPSSASSSSLKDFVSSRPNSTTHEKNQNKTPVPEEKHGAPLLTPNGVAQDGGSSQSRQDHPSVRGNADDLDQLDTPVWKPVVSHHVVKKKKSDKKAPQASSSTAASDVAAPQTDACVNVKGVTEGVRDVQVSEDQKATKIQKVATQDPAGKTNGGARGAAGDRAAKVQQKKLLSNDGRDLCEVTMLDRATIGNIAKAVAIAFKKSYKPA